MIVGVCQFELFERFVVLLHAKMAKALQVQPIGPLLTQLRSDLIISGGRGFL